MSVRGDAVSRPLLIYDGDCGFCRRWVRRGKKASGEKIDYAPLQTAAQQFPTIPRERFQRAVQLIEPDGRVSSGAAAVFRAAALAGRQRWLWSLYQRLPGFRFASERAYQFVAQRRPQFDRLERLLLGLTTFP